MSSISGTTARAFGLGDGQDGTTPRLLRQIVAAGCLLGIASQAEARALPGWVPGLSPSVKIGEWLRVLYPPGPGEAGWIGSLQPDRLAELHTMRELTASPDLARACLTCGCRQCRHLTRPANTRGAGRVFGRGCCPPQARLGSWRRVGRRRRGPTRSASGGSSPPGAIAADRILIAGRRHLHHTLSEYVDHYNTHRPHRTLSQQPRRGLRRGASWAAWPVLEVTDAVLALRRHAQQRHTRCLKLSEKPEPVPQLD